MQLPPLPWLLGLLLLLVHLSPSLIHPASSHSFIYHGFNSPDSTNLTLTGIARITPNGILKLTNVSSHQIGRGFYPDPIQFKTPDTQNDVVSFSTSFAFSIHPKFQKLGGHGLAFTVSPTKDFPGAQPSQFLGLLNVTLNGNTSNHLFAVEFDTVQDLEFSDIDNNHVGVNINRMKSVNSTPAGFFVDGNSTKQNLCLHSGRMIQAWIDYDGSKHQLDITLSGFVRANTVRTVRSNKPDTPIMSVPIDLSPVFHDFMFVGFSSSTGVLTSSHYVFGWSFNTTGKAESLDHDLLPSLQTLRKKNKGFVIKFSASLFSLLLAVLIVVITGGAYVIKRFKAREVAESWELDLGPRPFSYRELKDATKGFHEKQLLGFGGSGTVYKGVLPYSKDSKAEIAVKRISGKSIQGKKEFQSEVLTIGRLRHRSLVPLLGWSRNKGELLLVYDFMANGSLDKYIYSDKDPKMILTWGQRFKIINDISNGLLYLHEEWEQTVVHRDIKAGNVLLDSDLNGRLGDFGLAKVYDHGSNVDTTRVVGTLGYLAPELTRTGKPTTSSDVYAFGALLLEVVCGRRPIELKASPEELILVDWVWEKGRDGCLLEVVDSRLNGEFNVVEVTMVLKLGLMCSSNEPSVRPSLRQVIRYLTGELPLPEIFSWPRYGGEKGGLVVKIDDEQGPSLAKMKSW